MKTIHFFFTPSSLIRNLIRSLILSLMLGSATVWAMPVNINQADADSISGSLSGVGLKKAQAIISYREQNGPFKSAEELANVKGIGLKTIEKNKQDIQL